LILKKARVVDQESWLFGNAQMSPAFAPYIILQNKKKGCMHAHASTTKMALFCLAAQVAKLSSAQRRR
jgi:hypothetical protein